MRHGGRGGNRLRRLAAWAAGVAVLGLTGCSSGGGLAIISGNFWGNGGSRLIEPARAIRDATPPPPGAPRELAKAVLPPYLVEPGDVLLVTPIEPDPPAKPDDAAPDLGPPVRLPGDQTVMQDGTIDLGRYGRVAVAGKAVDQIEADVRQVVTTVHPKYTGTINVRIVSRVSKVFYVLGEVNAPGAFPLAGRETVLDAIIAAGGLTDAASQDNVVLSRPTAPDSCRVVLPVCYRQIVQVGDTATNYQLQPGDRVFVPTRGFFEGLCPDKYACPHCIRPQFPCTLGACAKPAAPAAPPAALPANPLQVPAEVRPTSPAPAE
jgi:polysaccharide export outer membrane protein